MKKLNATPSKSIAAILADYGIAPVQGQSIGVEMTIHLKGIISKGENEFAAQTCGALGLEDFARAFVQMGATEKAIKKSVILASLGKVKLSEEKELRVAEIVKEIQAIFTRLPKMEKEGKRTGKFVLTCDAGII